MAGPGSEEARKLTGLSKYFNAVTIQGRANVAKATYLGLFIIGAYLYLKPKKEKKADAN